MLKKVKSKAHQIKAQQKYIGETERKLKERICEHIGYINTKRTEQATGNHVKQKGHLLPDKKVPVLEHVKKSEPELKKIRMTNLSGQ